LGSCYQVLYHQLITTDTGVFSNVYLMIITYFLYVEMSYSVEGDDELVISSVFVTTYLANQDTACYFDWDSVESYSFDSYECDPEYPM